MHSSSSIDHNDADATVFDTRLRRWDAHIHAFVQGTVNAACDPASSNRDEPLSGLTVGVKDNIDVAGLPTRNGSAACKDVAPAAKDADVVQALRDAGAQIVGKTTTTEFAFTDPTDCRNPHDIRRSPGGSSSGSGAAVAAGLVDLALGTQTAGSLCRPAAYCGVVGFKPTYGLLPMTGITALAPSFDTVGLITRSVATAQRGLEAIVGLQAELAAAALDVSTALLDTDVSPSNDMRAALNDASQIVVGLGHPLNAVQLDGKGGMIVSDHRTLMNYEAAKAHPALLAANMMEKLKPKFRQALISGAATNPTDAADARKRLEDARQDFWQGFAETDIVLTLPVPEGAPLIGGTTGFQDWLTPWTVFGGPLVCLPWGCDRLGRPRAIMLAAHPGKDAQLLAFAAQLEKRAPDLPMPQLPSREA